VTDNGVIDPFGAYRRPGGVYGTHYCSAPHPTADGVYCRRQPGHDGDHAAYTFSMLHPDRWPT